MRRLTGLLLVALLAMVASACGGSGGGEKSAGARSSESTSASTRRSTTTTSTLPVVSALDYCNKFADLPDPEPDLNPAWVQARDALHEIEPQVTDPELRRIFDAVDNPRLVDDLAISNRCVAVLQDNMPVPPTPPSS
jgi:hypothetical protein